MIAIVGSTAQIDQLRKDVDLALGYPKFGVDAATGQPILPEPGQPIETVRGVTLSWTEIISHPSDPSQAAYPYDAVTGQVLNGMGLVPVELGPEWFPSLDES